MTDAKTLTEGFENAAREAAFTIAPERAQELVSLMGGETWYLDFEEGQANFTAYPDAKSIVGTYAGLLSIWATVASVRVLMIATQTAAEQGLKQIVIAPGTPASKRLNSRMQRSHLYGTRRQRGLTFLRIRFPPPTSRRQTV